MIITDPEEHIPQSIKTQIKDMSHRELESFVQKCQEEIDEIKEKSEPEYQEDPEGNEIPDLFGGLSGEEIAKEQRYRLCRNMALDLLPYAKRNGDDYIIKNGDQ